MASDWDYRGLAAECYDLWFGTEPFRDQRFFQRRLAANGGRGLEIASGTGRLLLPLLRDGLAVEGVDSSDEMLSICRRKAAAMGLSPVLHRQRMQELDLAERYRTLFIPACSFQILGERDAAFAALDRFRDHLEPGGELLVTLFVPWGDFRHGRRWRLRRSGIRPSDGATILIHEATSADRIEQVQDQWLRFEVFRDGEQIASQLRTHRLRWYHRHEFAMMLERSGFTDIALQSGYGGAGGAHDARAEMVFSARK